MSRRSPAVRAGLLIGSTHDAAQALLRTAAARTPAARTPAARPRAAAAPDGAPSAAPSGAGVASPGRGADDGAVAPRRAAGVAACGAAGAARRAGRDRRRRRCSGGAGAGAQRREGTGMTRSSMPVLMGALAGLAGGSGLAVQRVVASWPGDSAWERSGRATAVARLAEATWEAQRLALRLRRFAWQRAAPATATAIAAGAALGSALGAAQIAAGPQICWMSAWAAPALDRLGRALDTAWRPGASADASLVRDLDAARRTPRGAFIPPPSLPLLRRRMARCGRRRMPCMRWRWRMPGRRRRAPSAPLVRRPTRRTRTHAGRMPRDDAPPRRRTAGGDQTGGEQ